MRRALFAVLLTGCAGDTLPVYTLEQQSDDLIIEAAAVWGLEVEWYDRPYGAVQVTISDGTAELCGTAKAGARHGCVDRRVWSCPDVYDLAHEFGHVFDLDHERDSRNIMHRVAGTELWDWQYDQAQRRAARLRACTP